jgi:hypothetical protein
MAFGLFSPLRPDSPLVTPLSENKDLFDSPATPEELKKILSPRSFDERSFAWIGSRIYSFGLEFGQIVGSVEIVVEFNPSESRQISVMSDSPMDKGQRDDSMPYVKAEGLDEMVTAGADPISLKKRLSCFYESLERRVGFSAHMAVVREACETILGVKGGEKTLFWPSASCDRGDGSNPR